MSDAITFSADVHTSGRDLDVECRTMVTDSGQSFTLLRIGPVAFYPDDYQLGVIRDTIAVHLDPPDDRTPDRNWNGRRDDVTLLPIAGGCDHVPEYQPTPEDWAEYHAIFDQIDRTGDFPAALPGDGFPVRNRYSPEALTNIRRIVEG
jgi:hypothetical protein